VIVLTKEFWCMQAQLAGIEKSVLTLAQETRKAIGALAGEVDTKGAGVSRPLFSFLYRIMHPGV
jgi:hypothetical protein